ncbi:MAG: phosphatidylserine/phosphatidylglycerophosphate/cardiolipin synthase family protein [Acidobacteriota bacterium]
MDHPGEASPRSTEGNSKKHRRCGTGTRALAVVGAGALLVYGARVLINLFGTTLPYSMSECPGGSNDTAEFLEFLSLVTDAPVRHAHIEVLKNGPEFYPQEVAAIRRARRAIDMEFYEFKEGKVSRVFLEALTERAQAGVEVRVVLDAIGSLTTRRSYFKELRAAGGQMYWYHPLRWNTWQFANNRSHRKMLLIDGETAFVGGAGVADHWMTETRQGPPWRDSVFHLQGDAVGGLISTFSENWLEASGKILSGHQQFEFHVGHRGVPSLVVSSTPSGGGTHARILFQALIQSAKKSIVITTPYFLPDRSARRALEQASRRGVKVRILVAGPHIDHPAVRRASRHDSRHLLEAGAKIYEYQPSMIHAKIMVVDDRWCVFGSTNFDHRSFALNDEINVAAIDRKLAETLLDQFEDDLTQSKLLTLEMLKNRKLVSRAELLAGALLESES